FKLFAIRYTLCALRKNCFFRYNNLHCIDKKYNYLKLPSLDKEGNESRLYCREKGEFESPSFGPIGQAKVIKLQTCAFKPGQNDFPCQTLRLPRSAGIHLPLSKGRSL